MFEYRTEHEFYNVTTHISPRDPVHFVKLTEEQTRHPGISLEQWFQQVGGGHSPLGCNIIQIIASSSENEHSESPISNPLVNFSTSLN